MQYEYKYRYIQRKRAQKIMVHKNDSVKTRNKCLHQCKRACRRHRETKCPQSELRNNISYNRSSNKNVRGDNYALYFGVTLGHVISLEQLVDN